MARAAPFTPRWAIAGERSGRDLNVISPGPVRTAGLVDEIAKAVLFLASDDSSFVAGAKLFIDGGLTQV